MPRVRRSTSAGVTTISPDHWSSFAAYARTAASPFVSISASIPATTSRAAVVSVSAVLVARLR